MHKNLKVGGNFIISKVEWTAHFNKTGKKVIEQKQSERETKSRHGIIIIYYITGTQKPEN